MRALHKGSEHNYAAHGGKKPLTAARVAALMHDDVWPTILAKESDRLVLARALRYVTVQETCRACGVAGDSPLLEALSDADVVSAS